MENSEIISDISNTIKFDGEAIEFDEKILENFTKEELQTILEQLKIKKEKINEDNIEWLLGLSS